MISQKKKEYNAQYYRNHKMDICKRTAIWNKQYYADNAEAVKYRSLQRYHAHADTINQIKAQNYHNMKLAIFTHYGLKCELCDENRLGALNIDHILGGGNLHRKDISGGEFYKWLYQQYITNNDWPTGFRTLCANCNHREYLRIRPSLSMTQEAIKQRAKRAETKLNILKILGGASCTNCGCTDIDVLDIHHPDDDGSEHRKELMSSMRNPPKSHRRITGSVFHKALVESGDFISRRLAVLCRSCNSNAEFGREKFSI